MRKQETILFVMPRLPFPTTSGRKMSLYHYCRILSEELGYRLVVAAFLENGDEVKDVPYFIDRLEILPKASSKEKIKTIFMQSLIKRKLPMQVSLYFSENAKKIIDRIAEEEKPKIVIGDMVRSTEYIKDIRAFRIADLDDKISKRYERQYNKDIKNINPYGAFLTTLPSIIQKIIMFSPVKKSVLNREIKLLKKYEIQISKECDRTIFVAQKEANELNNILGQNKAVAIPIGVDINYYSYRICGSSVDIIGFLGAMDVSHNEAAVIHFIDDIFPIIHESKPDTKFLVIGGGVSERLKKYENENIIFTGRVVDVRKYLQKCKIFVCPMTFGSGIKTKNLEAMSLGLPVVTTLIGAENINAVNEKDWIVRDREKEFADSIIYLLNNDNYRLSIGKAGRDYVQREWRWDLVKDAFSSLLKGN